MTDVKDIVCARLDEMGIPYRRYRHEAAFTMEDCAAVDEMIGASVCKNYFLTTKSKKHYCLCVVRGNARLKTSDISKQAGTPRLSFADEADMTAMLRVHPGSVSPMGLMFDAENRVQLLVDRALADAGEMGFHPCDNTETIVLSGPDFFEKFLPAVGHSPKFVEIHDFLGEPKL